MDPGSPEHDTQPSEHVFSLINEYFDRWQAGDELTPESFAAEHPELADELRPHLAGLAMIEKARTSARLSWPRVSSTPVSSACWKAERRRGSITTRWTTWPVFG